MSCIKIHNMHDVQHTIYYDDPSLEAEILTDADSSYSYRDRGLSGLRQLLFICKIR